MSDYPADRDAEMAYVAYFGAEGAAERMREQDEAFAAGDAEAERLSSLAPGPELAAGLAAAQDLPMDRRAKILLLASWKRQEAWTKARTMVAMQDAFGDPDADNDASMVADAARQARLSESTVATELWQTRQAYCALGATWSAMDAGDLMPMHMWVMLNVTRNVPTDVARQVDATLAPRAVAKGWTPGELAHEARLLVIKLDPDGAEKRAADAKQHGSDVRLRNAEDEMALLLASGDAWTSRQIMDELNRRADEKRREGDDRNLGQLRFGSLAEKVLGEDTTVDEVPMPTESADGQAAAEPAPRSGPGRRPKRATTLLVMSLQTLLGGKGPAELVGYGPVTATTARRIAARDSVFQRLVFDELTGKPVEVSYTKHDLDPRTRDWIDARDRTCLFPGCQCPAAFCDADHAEEFPDGPTSCDNCGLLCRRHHNLKTKKLWDLIRNADDSVEWLSPNGFRYHREASTYAEFLDMPEPEAPDSPIDDDVGRDPDPPPDDDPPLPVYPPRAETPEDEHYDDGLILLSIDDYYLRAS